MSLSNQPHDGSLSLPLPVNYSDPPPWHGIGQEEFEKLCRDLIAEQPHIAECKLYGKRGQEQRGVDILASRRREGEGQEVAQCKCYKGFDKGDLDAALEPFLENIDYWRAQEVKRYYLIVASKIRDTGVQDAFLAYKQQLKRYDIAAELWDAIDLRISN